MRQPLAAPLHMVFASLAAAGSGAMIHLAAGRCDWRLVVASRAYLGLGFALLVARLARAPLVLTGPRELWIRSACGGVGLVCNFYAYAHLPTSTALVLTCTYPIWLGLLSALALGARPAPAVWLALVLGSGGVALLHPATSGDAVAIWVGLAGAMLLAVAMLAIHRLRGVAPEAVVVHFSAVAAVVTTAWLALTPGGVAVAPLAEPEVAALLAAIALSSTLANTAGTRAFARGSAPVIAALSNLRVAFGAGLDVALLGQAPGVVGVVGLALVVVPAALVGYLQPRPPAGGSRVIEAAIARAERRTSCEVRVVVDRAAGPDLDRRGRDHFDALGMTATRRRNALLVHVAIADRSLRVLADIGLAPHGDAIARCGAGAEARLRRSEPVPIVVGALIAELAELVAATFPWDASDVDELPDAVAGDPHLI